MKQTQDHSAINRNPVRRPPPSIFTLTTVALLAGCAAILTLAACANPAIATTSIWGSGAPAATWRTLGTAGFSTSNVAYTSMAIEPSTGTPFIAFEDGAVGARTTVMKYMNGAWTLVGTQGFSPDTAQYVNLAFDSNGVPYVAYWDPVLLQVDVMVYTGTGVTGWQSLGLPVFAGTAFEVALAINASNVPFVAIRDSTSALTVMSYSGTWTSVGSTVATAASYISLAFDNTGLPWVGYADGTFGNNATVMRFDGATWTVVGPGIGSASTGAAAWTSLVIDKKDMPNTPYLACMDTGYGSLLTVKRYLSSAGAWVNVGSPGFSLNQPSSVSLALTRGGVPYVGYQDGATGGATVMTFSGTGWSAAGSPGFSPGQAQSTSLALDSLGALYVAFMDMTTLPINGRATVMAFK
jgi:hypothetical protein